MEFPGKNLGVVCHFTFQGIILIQGSNMHLRIGRWILYHRATWEAQAGLGLASLNVSSGFRIERLLSRETVQG